MLAKSTLGAQNTSRRAQKRKEGIKHVRGHKTGHEGTKHVAEAQNTSPGHKTRHQGTKHVTGAKTRHGGKNTSQGAQNTSQPHRGKNTSRGAQNTPRGQKILHGGTIKTSNGGGTKDVTEHDNLYAAALILRQRILCEAGVIRSTRSTGILCLLP